MRNYIQANLLKPSNEKLGRFFDVHESTIRKRIKETPEVFDENLRVYRMAKAPFIKIEDYNIEKGTQYKEEDVENLCLPAVINKDNYFLIPTVMDDMRASLDELKKFNECCVISLSNFKGGVGKSSMAVNISTALAALGNVRVLIVDFDIQGNTTSLFDLYRDKLQSVREKEKATRRIDIKLSYTTKLEELYDFENSDYKYTIVDLLAASKDENIKEMVKDSIVDLNDKVNTIGKIDIIPNSSNIENALKFENINIYLRGTENKALDAVLSYVKDDYDFIIIDTPPSISLPLRMSTMATDYFVLVLTPDKLSKDGIAPFLVPIELHKDEYRQEKGKDIVVLGGVLNKYQKVVKSQQINKDSIDRDLAVTTEYAGLGNARLFGQTIKHDNVLNEALNQTGSVLAYNPTHELVRDFFNLTTEIVDSITIDKMSKQRGK